MNFHSYYFDVETVDLNLHMYHHEYVKTRMEYLDETDKNYNLFNKLFEIYKHIHVPLIVNDNHYIYTFNDTNKVNDIKKQMKAILMKQHNLYTNFIHYQDSLLKNRDRLMQQKPKVQKYFRSLRLNTKRAST